MRKIQIIILKSLKQVIGSYLDGKPKKPTPKQFEELVKEAEAKRTGNNKVAADLTEKYFKLLKDKTLLENQTPIQQNFRKEVLGDMINFAIDLNNDDLEDKNDMGSIAMITILLKSNLALKDFANKLEYDLKQLQMRVGLIESSNAK